MYAITIVGGKGERLRPLTDDRPKCMVQLAGRPILEHHIEWLRSSGVTHLVVSCGHFHHVIQEYFGAGESFGIRIAYAVEQEQLGRGGAFKLAYQQVPEGERFIIGTNGDNINTQSLPPVIEQHEQTGSVATLLLTQLRSPYGIVRTKGKKITGFDEKPLLPHWLSAGVYVFNQAFFNELPDKGDHEDELFPRLAAEGRLYGFQSTAYWKAIDTVKDLREAEEALTAKGNAPSDVR
jgi:NDP-sugar pyrophosphorylase family protein